jgi:hypothetical protein
MIKLKTLTEILLSLLLARILIFGAGIGDALAFISLVGCYSFGDYLKLKEKVFEEQKKPDPNKEIMERLENIEKKSSNTEAKMATLTMAGRGLR